MFLHSNKFQHKLIMNEELNNIIEKRNTLIRRSAFIMKELTSSLCMMNIEIEQTNNPTALEAITARKYKTTLKAIHKITKLNVRIEHEAKEIREFLGATTEPMRVRSSDFEEIPAAGCTQVELPMAMPSPAGQVNEGIIPTAIPVMDRMSDDYSEVNI